MDFVLKEFLNRIYILILIIKYLVCSEFELNLPLITSRTATLLWVVNDEQ